VIVVEDDEQRVDVVVVAADAFDDLLFAAIRRWRQATTTPVVVVSRDVDEQAVLRAVEAGAVAILRSHEVTADRLVRACEGACRGESTMPPDLLSRLLGQVRDVQLNVLSPRGLTFAGVSQREIDILRLVAEGYDTREIAGKLAYSERTIKSLIQDVTRRFGLRNRSHAVAFALRQGMI
jgi:DNA-binding NarL/FixJ family response regulator